MLFRFDNFCENWAMAYTPISHVPSKDGRQARFFRHNSLDERAEIHKRLAATDKCDLFMSVITAFDGELIRSSEQAPDPNFYIWRRHVLFWSHQSPANLSRVPADEEAAAEAKARGVEAATDFLAFVATCQDSVRFPRPADRIIDGVDLDSVEISTLPMAFDGWWVTVINFDQMEPRQKCANPEKYDQGILARLWCCLCAKLSKLFK